MILKNSTAWPNWFLRRMLSWCCTQLRDIGVRDLSKVTFRNSKRAYGGLARPWRKEITVCVGKAERFPTASMTHRNGHSVSLADRLEALVWVTAHEVAHVLQEKTRTRAGGAGGGSEIATEWHAKPVVEAFRAQREQLLVAWEEPPAVALRLRPTPVEARSIKAQADLARWERKLKLAKTKVAKLRQRVAYYQKTGRICDNHEGSPFS